MKYRLFHKRKRHKNQSLPEISLTPLIDTALTLLIIFMVTTPILKKENALKVELPKGKVQEIKDSDKKELRITIQKGGKLAFNDKVMEKKDLLNALAKEVVHHKNPTVFVDGDTKAPYGTVIEMVDTVKQIKGIQYVALATTRIT